ncbi:hypothetical protein FM042_08960 [Aliidiomarina halalkaliphila]|uniref:Uncharacterized protein n=1 Tax=Aliidiomarina halalkaliphila TaxID=2593535 RepID=A0A552X134_9GAMM|nr:hypothetical protein [Aliidiomarina halalkaliphila]TRW48303.1 hypothetical protein FM042_08960 [Aliidiomarina halalkaliphila]
MAFNFLTPFPQRWHQRCQRARHQLYAAFILLLITLTVQLVRIPSALTLSEREALQQFRLAASQPQIHEHQVQALLNFIASITALDTAFQIPVVRMQNHVLTLEMRVPRSDTLAMVTDTLDITGWQQQSVVIEPEAPDASFVRMIWTFHHAY